MEETKLPWEKPPIPAENITVLPRKGKRAKHAKLPAIGHKRAKVKRAGKQTQKQKKIKKIYGELKIAKVNLDTGEIVV